MGMILKTTTRGNKGGGSTTIPDSSVTTSKIANEAVTFEKLSPQLQNQIEESGDATSGAVRYDIAQELTAAQREQSFVNLGVPTVFLDATELGTTLSAERAEQVASARILVITDSTNLRNYTMVAGNTATSVKHFFSFENTGIYKSLTLSTSTRKLSSTNSENMTYGATLYNKSQSLSSSQQSLARKNIAAMANTPSGDPMHYMYEAAGAVYDATTDKWSFSRTVSAIGRTFTVSDLTTEEVRTAYMDTYAQCRTSHMDAVCNNLLTKFAFTAERQFGGFSGTPLNMSFAFGACINLKQFIGSLYYPQMATYAFRNCNALESVVFNAEALSASGTVNMFSQCVSLVDFYLDKLTVSINLADSPLVSPASLAWTINHTRYTTSTYSITLHHDAYVVAMADAAVVAALEAYTGVTLIDAGATA